jgi:type VI secretion system protein ImpA
MTLTLPDLLAPIAPAAPCGEDLSFSAEFDAILEMRRADDPTLDQGEWVTELKQADWAGAAAQCEALLRTRTKDIRVAVWLIEALARRDGFAGLQRGLEALAGLCERYWDTLHPRAEGADGAEQRIGNLSWLAARGVDFVRTVPLTDAEAGRFSLRDHEAARALAAVVQRGAATDGEPVPSERPTLDAFDKAARDSTPEFLQTSLRDAVAARAALQRLQGVLDRRLGTEGPSFAPIREALDDAVRMAERLARSGGAGGGTDVRPAPAATIALTRVEELPPSAAIPSRAHALQQLRLVAEYFRRTEPHSPVAYLASKAAQWGEMPLHEWLRTVLKDAAALAHVEELLGIAKPPQGKDGA